MGNNKLLILFFLMLAVISVEFLIKFGPTITGFAVYSLDTFIPATAVDQWSNDQISPSGGTVDVSDNTVQQVVYGSTNTYIEVTEWDQSIPESGIIISNAIVSVESDNGITRGADLIFRFYNESGWQTACIKSVNNADTFSCDLHPYGVDTALEVNNLRFRAIVGDHDAGTPASLSIDYITIAVNYTDDMNQTSETGTVSFDVKTNIFISLPDDIINLGTLAPSEGISSENVSDWFEIQNDGSVNFDAYVYGAAAGDSPFTSTTGGANTLPNDYYLVHCYSADSGACNTTYTPVPADVSTRKLIIDGLQKESGLDSASIGISVTVPEDEGAGTKTADLVIYAEVD